ncbi:MAG: hypothetical protein ACQET8_17465, partial [Bacillota bacterium]
MPFTEELPEWNAAGTKPPQSKLDAGWQPSDKPPADWWNWFQYTVYQAIKEMQEKAIHVDQKGMFDGVAGLDSSAKVPRGNLPTVISTPAGDSAALPNAFPQGHSIYYSTDANWATVLGITLPANAFQIVVETLKMPISTYGYVVQKIVVFYRSGADIHKLIGVFERASYNTSSANNVWGPVKEIATTDKIVSAVTSVNGQTGAVTLDSEKINKINPLSITDLPSAYPNGMSYFELTEAQADPWELDIGHAGTFQRAIVQTIKTTGSYSIIQRIILHNSTNPPVTYERSSSANNSWQHSWKKVISRDEFTAFQDEVNEH